MVPSWNSTDKSSREPRMAEGSASCGPISEGMRYERWLGFALWTVLIVVLIWVGKA